MDVPWRREFDAARDPYTARIALGITSTGGSGGGAPVGAEYVTSSADATLTNERVLTNTASITWDFSTPGQAKASTTGGGGNVSNSGTPTVGQYAKWVTATTIQGVAPATVLSDIGAQPAGSYQPLDADLTAIAALTGTNTIYYRSAANTWAAVTIGANLTFSGGTLAATGGTGGTSTTISDTPPGSPTAGSMWWESDSGTLWIYYNDGTSSQWVAAAGGGAAAVLPGALVQIQRQDVSSAVASVDFTSGIDATYEEYEIHILGFMPSVSSQLGLRFSQDGGATFKSGASDYSAAYTGWNAVNSSLSFGAAAAHIWIGADNVFASAGFVGNYRVTLYRPSGTTFRKQVSWSGVGGGSTALWSGNGGGHSADNNAVNAIRFFPIAGGNITAGTFILYGIKK